MPRGVDSFCANTAKQYFAFRINPLLRVLSLLLILWVPDGRLGTSKTHTHQPRTADAHTGMLVHKHISNNTAFASLLFVLVKEIEVCCCFVVVVVFILSFLMNLLCSGELVDQ